MTDEMTVSDEQLTKELTPVIAKATSMIVQTPEQYIVAIDYLKAVKEAQNRVVTHFAGIKKAAHEAHKAITAKEAESLKPLKDAEATLKNKATKYQLAEECRRLEEQRRLQAEADARARAEQEALEKSAAKLKTPEKAEALREQAAAIVAPVINVAPTFRQATGTSIKKAWQAVVVDELLVPREWLVVNQKALDSFAKSTKGNVKVAGVKFKEVSSLAVRL